MDNGISGFFAGLAALGASILPGTPQDKPAAAPQPEQPAIVQDKQAGAQPRAALPVEMRLLPPRRPVAFAVASAAPAAPAPEPRRSAEPLAAPAAPPSAKSEARRPTDAAGASVASFGAPLLAPSFQPLRPEPGAAPPARPVVTASALPEGPAPQPASAAEPKRATAAAPPRPVQLDSARALAPPATLVAAAPAAAPAPRAQVLTDQEIVDKANAFFNNLTTLVADFTQIGGDGRRLGGTLYLQRPGKVRFEYDKPATLEVIADGSSVAVQDTKLATQDLYPISQTPLKFLLRERVSLGQDIRVTGVSNDGDAVRVSLEDRSTLGGTSKITLFFDPQVETLTQWRIIDPQGFQTTVMLGKVDRNRRIDQKLFVININRAINNDNFNR